MTLSRRRNNVILMLNQCHSLVILCLDGVEFVFFKYLIIQECQHTMAGLYEIPIPEMQLYFNLFYLPSAVKRYVKYMAYFLIHIFKIFG